MTEFSTRIRSITIRRIPDYFMERYDDEIAVWAHNFAKIGPIKAIVLKEGPFSDPSPNPEQGPVLYQVKLLARLSREGVEIEPYTEQDAMLIALHCEKMRRLKIPPRAFWKEPPRPWVPFMPHKFDA